MQWVKRPFFLVLIVGLSLALAMLVGSFLFLDPPECPTGYTQQQIDETGCIIGANIGLGLGLLASIATAALTVIIALILLVLPAAKRLLGRKQ